MDNNLKQMLKQIQTQINLQGSQSDLQYNCPLCKDKGSIIYISERDGREYMRTCDCEIRKRNEENFNKTALASKKDIYTFEKYIANEPWQQGILEKAKEYANNPCTWFFIGGQVGAGKTHICTAILQELMKKNKVVTFKYILFNEELTKLKQLKYEDKSKYEDILYSLKNTSILFIDDLFKVEPTKADIEILFDIINDRYLTNKICLISSEKTAMDLLELDEGVVSRILEKCESNVINIGKDMKKNYRIKNILCV